LTHAELFFQGENPFAAAGIPRFHVHAVKPSVLKKLGRYGDYTLHSYFLGRQVLKKHPIDLVHFVEPAQYRITRPTALLPGAPFIFGPVNGGDNYPSRSFLQELDKSRGRAGFSCDTSFRAGMAGFADRFNHALVFGPIARLSTEQAFRKARRIVYGTRACLNNIPPRYHRKTVFCPCFGIDPLKVPVRDHTTKNEYPVILYAGRITHWKGLDLLLRAFANLAKSRTVRLNIVGTGTGNRSDEYFERFCRGLVDTLHITDKVLFSGQLPREKLLETMRVSDIFCMPSLWEPFAVVYLEAIASGLPVIGLATGGTPDLIEDNTFGYAIKTGSLPQCIDDLSQVLADLIDNPDKRRRMGLTARGHLERHYSWDAVGDRMEEIYQEAL
jgi:glycosyltransferase involved in cell wall biosynthesis